MEGSPQHMITIILSDTEQQALLGRVALLIETCTSRTVECQKLVLIENHPI